VPVENDDFSPFPDLTTYQIAVMMAGVLERAKVGSSNNNILLFTCMEVNDSE